MKILPIAIAATLLSTQPSWANETFHFVAAKNINSNVQAKSQLKIANLNVKSTAMSPKLVKLEVEAGTENEALQALVTSGLYDKVEVDLIVSSGNPALHHLQNHSAGESKPPAEPNDTLFADQRFYFNELAESDFPFSNTRMGHNILNLWDKSKNEQPIRVGVIDGGFVRTTDVHFAEENADFTNNTNAFEYTEEEKECENWHGTGVAGTIGTQVNNEHGTAGVSDNVEMVAARSLLCGSGRLSSSAEAILWLAGDEEIAETLGIAPISEPVKIINMSLGAFLPNIDYACPFYLKDAIDYASSKGIIIFASAGNDGANLDEHTVLPAECDNVISVGALDTTGDIASFSNYNSDIDVTALGVSVAAPAYGHGEDVFGYWSGTSFSAPIVSGIAAEILKDFPTLSIEQITRALNNSAYSYEDTDMCTTLGDVCAGGIINGAAAYDLSQAIHLNYVATAVPALNSDLTCDNAFLENNFTLDYPLCEHFELIVPIGALDTNAINSVVRAPLGSELSTNNPDLDVLATHNPEGFTYLRITNADLSNFEYGIRACTGEDCTILDGDIVLPETIECN